MKQSCRISNPIQVVDEMAFRANLLALNAAIVLAGPSGNGAACESAANEIRCLAKRRALAADGIAQDEAQTF